MSQLPRYENYKESGVQWLGEIPSHWIVKRLKFVVANIGEKVEAKESSLRYFGLENIESFTGKLLDSVEIESEGIAHRFRKNDVLFGKLRPYLAKVFLALEDGLSSTEALVFRSSEAIYPRFLSYYCLSQDFINEVNGTTFGSKMPRASWDDISSFRIVYPEYSEQKVITDFLDKRLAQLDALIAKQETLLEKLAEQRIALISHAVTKGLNPDVALRDSNSKILGFYPDSWSVKRLRFEIITNPSKSEIELDENEFVSFIPMEAVSIGGGLDLSNERMISEVLSGYTYFREGDVVVAKITPCFENGKASIAENLHQGVAFGTTELHVLRCKTNILNKFLFFIIQSDKFMKFGESEMYGAGGQKRVPERFIKDYLIALPSLNEQKEICEFIESQLSKIDGLFEKVKNTISTFSEYRSTLITQVVTGKIDVRGLSVS